MHRRPVTVLLLAVALAGVACRASGSGPAGAVAAAEVTPDDAIKAAAARAAAEAFVQAYASDTGTDVGSLEALAGTPLVKGWVHWLGVQNREFPGTISGAVTNELVGPAAPFAVTGVAGSDTILRQVDVRATITFALHPTVGQGQEATRSLDGPMRLIQARDGSWKILDFTRDGVLLTQEFEVLKPAPVTHGGVRIAVGAFLSAPYWQFGLEVSSRSAVSFTTAGTELLDATGSRAAAARAITGSLARVRPGKAVEGMVTFPTQPNAAGLTLHIVLRGSAGPIRFSFALGSLIHPPLFTGSATPPPSPAG
ncbi:MAG: hypothetical protein ACXVQ0_04575 [Actinomycetota bacterium]